MHTTTTSYFPSNPPDTAARVEPLEWPTKVLMLSTRTAADFVLTVKIDCEELARKRKVRELNARLEKLRRVP